MYKYLRAFLLCGLFHGLGAHAQIISTVAGIGIAGYSGEGVPATATELWNPAGLAVDSVGNIFFTETLNYRARKVTAGIISTVIGNGTAGYSGDGTQATMAQISSSRGLEIDRYGNVYVTQASDYMVIRKVNAVGIITTFAGTGTPGFSGDGGPATAAKLDRAREIRSDSIGNLYLTDFNNNRIRKIDTSGIISTIAGIGTPGFSGDGGFAISAQINGPQGIAIDRLGNIFFNDYNNSRVRKIDRGGIITTVAGNGTFGSAGDGGPATAAEVNATAISVDDTGNLFICDYNRVCEIIAATGIITTIAGDGSVGFSGDGGPASAAVLYTPHTTAIDKAGDIYITDLGNQRVRKITMPVISIGSSADTICAGTNVVFNALVTNDASVPTYQWKINNTNVGTDTSVYVTNSLHNNDTVTCVLTYFFGHTVKRVSNNIIVKVDSFPPHAGLILGSAIVCIGDSILLTDSTSGGVWSNTNSKAVVSNGFVTGITPGRDTISYVVGNACGKDTAKFIIQIRDCKVSVDNIMENNTLIFPNPNCGFFTVSYSSKSNEPTQITITDITGRKVKELAVNTNRETEISLSQPGLYFVTVSSETGRWYQKVVVQ